MQSLYYLPKIESLLQNKEYSNALLIANETPEALACYFLGKIPDDLELVPRDAIILAKLQFLQGDYKRCIMNALLAKDLINELDEFYRNGIIYRMMEFLCNKVHGNDIDYAGVKSYILSIIKDTPIEDKNHDSFLGFLSEISEFDLVKEKIIQLSKTKIDCRKIINTLLKYYHDDIYKVFLETDIENSYLLHYKIDAYVYDDNKEGLNMFLCQLEWRSLYEACFYIEDTYHLKMPTNDNDKVNEILSGKWKQKSMSTFMLRSSKISFKFLENMSKARAPYISLCNCIMNAGTTNDTLYRNNEDVVNGKGWVRFVEYSSIGMIHQESINAFEIFKKVLPSFESKEGEGGALMALGMMNIRTKDREVVDFLLDWIISEKEEFVFGACMGLGLCLLESSDNSTYEKLKNLFSVDNTIVQEAALYGIGLIFAGSGNESVLEYISTIQAKTDFPRVKRVAGTSLALINIHRSGSYHFTENVHNENQALEKNNNNGLSSNDASERESTLLSLGTAFVATSNLLVIKQILPLINDGDDDVKRAAVIALMLIGCDEPSIISSCIIPLGQNHNSYVRATVAILLGLFNSGTGNVLIANVLEAMLYDSVDLVRQSACIGAGFILSQMNPDIIPNYKRILDKINHIIVSKGESNCVKMGASIGRSIAEMSGRTAIFSLRNFFKKIEKKRVAGALLFIQSWYWYPLISCISLCIHPTPIFILDQELNNTDHLIQNNSKFYDYLIKLPEVRRSRRNKISKEDSKDTTIKAPNGLSSGMRLTYFERNLRDIYCPVIFKDKNEEPKILFEDKNEEPKNINPKKNSN